jgi:type II secretory pathway pseudopilin PulG
MFLKKKKLRGMSLVELLAYTVILSIVTTALFQLIHFIQNMNDENVKQQQIYNAFNLALLDLENFVTSKTSGQLSVANNSFCLGSTSESFYFVQDSITNTYYLCHDQKSCPQSLSPSSTQPCSQGLNKGELISEKPIFQKGTNSNFFQITTILSDPNHFYDEVTYDFYVSQPDLVMNFTSLTQ